MSALLVPRKVREFESTLAETGRAAQSDALDGARLILDHTYMHIKEA